MSRFFAASSSSEDEDDYSPQQKGNRFGTFYDSDEESEQTEFSDEVSSEEIDEPDVSGEDNEATMEATKRNRFLFGSDSDSDEEDDGHRLVKSAKDKAQEEFSGLCEEIADRIDEKEWASALTDYDKLLKCLNKNGRYITEQVCDLFKLIENETNEISAEEKKKMNGNDAKGFNALKQKNKKTMASFADILKSQTVVVDVDGEKGGKNVEEQPAQKTIEMTSENVLLKLQEVISSRGRKHADKQENLAVLRKLFDLSLNDRHRVQVLIGTISAEFDMAASSLGYLQLETWNETVQDTDRLIALLKALCSSAVEVNREAEEFGLPGLDSIHGSLASFAQRLDDEFIKALQIVDPHTSEYEEFLAAEKGLYDVLGKTYAYLSNTEFRCQILLRQLEHIYFRPGSVNVHLGATDRTVGEMCSWLYKEASDKVKTRAFLCHVYHLALHGNYTVAREIFFASHITEHLASLDISTQILYNRTVVQLGLAAFQRGLLKEAYFALQEICSSGRPRELLAQGLGSQKLVEKTIEQERAERQRQLPYHMHLSIELIDSVFLTASMLLEIPQAAAGARRFFRGDRKLFPSRHLRRLMDAHDRTLFNGPPESTRDHIIAAAKSLANGNWRECLRMTLSTTLWGLFLNSPDLSLMLERKVKESSVCAYLLAFGPTFKTIDLSKIALDFEVTIDIVRAIIDNLVIEHGLPATVEDNSGLFLVWTQEVELTPVQDLVLQLKDKLSVLAERNIDCVDLIKVADMVSSN